MARFEIVLEDPATGEIFEDHYDAATDDQARSLARARRPGARLVSTREVHVSPRGKRPAHARRQRPTRR
jgi:hypothetical protein